MDFLNKFTTRLNERPKERLMAICTVILIIFAICWGAYSRTYETTDDAYIEGRIVPISPKVYGYITAIHVSDNQMLEKGQIILELDSKDYQFKLDKAKSDIISAKSNLDVAQENYESIVITAPSTYEEAKSNYQSAMARYEKIKGDLDRLQGLTDLTRTRKDLDHAIADEKTAKSDLEAAKAKMDQASSFQQKIDAAKATLLGLEAELKDTEALMKQAEKDLADTKIYAPYSGRVTNRLVEVGAYIQPGQSLLSIVGKEMWVVANLKETQLHKVKPGQEVDIKIDAFPNHKFKGKVDSIQTGTGSRLSLFPPENATGNFVKVVQRVPVKIVFSEEIDPDISLAIGMSVIPVIKTGW